MSPLPAVTFLSDKILWLINDLKASLKLKQPSAVQCSAVQFNALKSSAVQCLISKFDYFFGRKIFQKNLSSQKYDYDWKDEMKQ